MNFRRKKLNTGQQETTFTICVLRRRGEKMDSDYLCFIKKCKWVTMKNGVENLYTFLKYAIQNFEPFSCKFGFKIPTKCFINLKLRLQNLTIGIKSSEF